MTVVASALVGVVWGLLAPAEHLLVVSAGRGVSLTGESVHRFDAAAMFACAGLVTGILAAAAAWTERRSRGPAALGALVAGAVVGAGAMALVGMGVAALRFPDPDTSESGLVVAMAPGIGTVLVLIFQPLAACVVTLVLAALNPYDDLGVTDHAEHIDNIDHADDAPPIEHAVELPGEEQAVVDRA